MQIFQLRHLLVATVVVALSACNGGEDFEDPIPGNVQEPGSGANFNPDDNCEPRIVGAFVHDGTVRNLGYRCDGYYGTTGSVGLEFERDAHYFVCPIASRTVEFFVGGRLDRLSLGTARFRETSQTGQECSAEKYDAAGPYVFSIPDLFDAPARVDVFDATLETESRITSRSRNTSALLLGLDMNPAADVTEISSLAHTLLTEGDSNFVRVDLSQDFTSFKSEAEVFLDEIETAAADQGMASSQTGSLPATTDEADAAIRDGASATAAGIYLLPVFVSPQGGESALWWYMTDYALAQAHGETLDPDVAVWDALFRDIPGSAFLSETRFDSHLATYGITENYLPMIVVDRHGRVSGGGPFEAVTMEPLAFNCDLDTGDDGGRYPVYLGLEEQAQLTSDLVLDSFLFSTIPGSETDPHALTLEGRFMNGSAYNGIARQTPDSVSDYDKDYPDTGVHAFTDGRDSTRLSGNLCGFSFSRQIVVGLHRTTAVTPNLDEVFMQKHFSTPGAFTLTYLARGTVDGEIDQVVAELPVTIHLDGSVLTDLYPEGAGDGNPNYDSTETIPQSEYAIGMVSSAYKAEEGNADSADGVNLLIFNFASPDAAEGAPGYLPLPRYGSHFVARLEPGDESDTTCKEHMFRLPGRDGVVDRTAAPYWYDPYAVSRAYRSSPIPMTREAKYEILRQEAYGFVSARRTGCS